MYRTKTGVGFSLSFCHHNDVKPMRQSNSQFHLAWRSFGSLFCFGSNTKTRMIQHILQWSIQCFHGVSSAFMEPRNNCGDKAASNSITIQYCYPKQYWLWLNRNGHGLMLAKSYRYRYLRATTRPWGPCHRRTRTKSYHLKPIQDPARRSSISSACCWQ